MKLERIRISNFLGLRALDLKLSTPITIIAGPNAAGKSTVRDAIELALTGSPRRVALKKDFDRLVNDQSKSGRVSVSFDGDRQATFTLPAGNWVESVLDGRDPSEISIGLDAQRFAALSLDERRTFLFAAMKVATSSEAIRARLVAKGLDRHKVEQVIPMLRGGFEPAHKEAAGAARDAKGAWRGVTGETWGAQKAPTWEPPGVEWSAVDEQDLTMCANRIASNRAAQDAENEAAGAYRAKVGAYEEAAMRRNRLKAEADKAAEAMTNAERAQRELAEQRDRLTKMREAAKPPRLEDCPACGACLEVRPDALVEVDRGTVAASTVTAADLAKHEGAERMLENALASRQRALGAAQAAVQTLSTFTMPEAPGDPPASRLEALRREFDELSKQRDELVQRQHAGKERAGKIKVAADMHADVVAWLAIADELAPDGIPDELVREAVGPLNERAAWAAQIAGWSRPAIAPDMSVEANSRPYPLLSESEKWRVDAVLACVFAAALETGIVLLDRWDVLDIPSRGQALKMLRAVRGPFGIDSAILFGTLKEAPKGPLPSNVAAVWLPDLTVAAAGAEAVAA
jgi:ferredoxin